MTDPLETLLRPAEAAKVLNVGERTFRQIVSSGNLRYILVGARSKRYHPADLQAYIDERRKVACPSTRQSPEKPLTGPTPSHSGVFDFEALRAARRGKKPNSKKPG